MVMRHSRRERRPRARAGESGRPSQPRRWASGSQSRAKPGQMALQPSGTAPVQPGPTLAVQTFLYPNKTIKPSSMKGSIRDCVGSERTATTTHITGVLAPREKWVGGKPKAAERIVELDLGSQDLSSQDTGNPLTPLSGQRLTLHTGHLLQLQSRGGAWELIFPAHSSPRTLGEYLAPLMSASFSKLPLA